LGGWKFKVGPRYQITIRKLAPVLNFKPGDYITFEMKNGEVVVRKKEVVA